VEYREVIQHPHAPDCAIVIGGSSYDPAVDAIAFKWKVSNGSWSRPAGEFDKFSFLLAMRWAAENGFCTLAEGVEALLAGHKARTP
jgi:hypothetical protein